MPVGNKLAAFSAWKRMTVSHQDEFRWNSQLEAAAALPNTSKIIRFRGLNRPSCPVRLA